MTRQQKIWLGGKTVVQAVKPLLVYLFLPGICMSIGMMLRGYRKTAAEFVEESGNFYTFVSLLLVIFWYYRACKRRGKSLWEETTLFCRDADKKMCGICLLLGISASLLLSSVLTLLPQWLIGSYSEKSSFIFRGTDIILVIATVCFLAPVIEEVVFRGFMLNKLLTFFSEKSSVLISSAFFAVCHANLLWIIYAFFMGIFLAELSLKKDNILYSICVHIGFNTPSVIIACIQATGHGTEIFFGNKIIILLYGLIGLASCRLLFLKMKRGGE